MIGIGPYQRRFLEVLQKAMERTGPAKPGESEPAYGARVWQAMEDIYVEEDAEC